MHVNTQSQKIQDKVTGAHFNYKDMCKRLNQLLRTHSATKKINKVRKNSTLLKFNKQGNENIEKINVDFHTLENKTENKKSMIEILNLKDKLMSKYKGRNSISSNIKKINRNNMNKSWTRTIHSTKSVRKEKKGNNIIFKNFGSKIKQSKSKGRLHSQMDIKNIIYEVTKSLAMKTASVVKQ